jgi:hypothetical protein
MPWSLADGHAEMLRGRRAVTPKDVHQAEQMIELGMADALIAAVGLAKNLIVFALAPKHGFLSARAQRRIAAQLQV